MLIGQRASQMGRISPYNDINERRISGILKECILKSKHFKEYCICNYMDLMLCSFEMFCKS